MIVYSTDPTLEVELVDGGPMTLSGCGDSRTILCGPMSAGPFDLDPGECQDVRVSFTPGSIRCYNEVIIIHSSLEIRTLPVSGCGVDTCYAQWLMNINVSNALGGVGNNQDLTFGGGVGATDSIDACFGERGLLPLLLSEVFDARFQVDGSEGSIIDVHDCYYDQDSFIVQWQAGTGGYPVTVRWHGDLPLGEFHICDDIGRTVIPCIDMSTTDELLIAAEDSIVTGLEIWIDAVMDTTAPEGPRFLHYDGSVPGYSIDLEWDECIEKHFAYYRDSIRYDRFRDECLVCVGLDGGYGTYG